MEQEGGAKWAPALQLCLGPALAVSLAYGIASTGGFTWPESGIFALLLTGVALIGVGLRLLARTELGSALIEIGGFAALATGLVASSLANGWPEATRVPLAALLAAASSFVIARVLVARGRAWQVLELLTWVGVFVSATGLVALAFHDSPWALLATGVWRLGSIVKYSNAAAGLLVLCIPAVLVLMVRRGGVVLELAAYLLLAGLLATVSRGGLLAAFVLAATLAVLSPRVLLGRLLRPFVGACVAFAAYLPTIVEDQPHPIPALAGLVVGGLIVLALRRLPRKAAIAGVALVLLAGVGVTVALQSLPKAQRFITSRFNPASDPRLRTWGNHIDFAMDEPLTGHGIGTFTGPALYSHNEYVQVFVETGAFGLVGVVVGATAFSWAGLRRRGPGVAPELWAAAIASGVAFLVHSSVDFIWRFHALVSIAFLWLGAATAPTEGAGEDY